MWRRLLVITGLTALAAWLVRRRPAATAPAAPAADPSGELRRRLDEARRREEEAQALPVEAAEAPSDLEERRRGVHERARAAADELRGISE